VTAFPAIARRSRDQDWPTACSDPRMHLSSFRALALCAGASFVIALAACGGGGIGSPTGPDTPAPTQNPATATSLTFSGDVQPILNSDCVR
jgi:hypothetical protein